MLFSLALLFTHFVTPIDTGYQEYCNARFGCCIEYPQGFKGEGESQNGDGQSFLSKDKKAEISVWGRLMLEDIDADEKTGKVTMEKAFQSSASDIKVVYKSVHEKEKWFIYSGTDKEGNIVYRKEVLKKIQYFTDTKPDTWVWYVIYYQYPAAMQAQYGAYCGKIAKSL